MFAVSSNSSSITCFCWLFKTKSVWPGRTGPCYLVADDNNKVRTPGSNQYNTLDMFIEMDSKSPKQLVFYHPTCYVTVFPSWLSYYGGSNPTDGYLVTLLDLLVTFEPAGFAPLRTRGPSPTSSNMFDVVAKRHYQHVHWPALHILVAVNVINAAEGAPGPLAPLPPPPVSSWPRWSGSPTMRHHRQLRKKKGQFFLRSAIRFQGRKTKQTGNKYINIYYN